MAGFVNSFFLIVAVFFIIVSSIERLFSPSEIKSSYVIVMGLIAFFVNAFSAYILGFHHHHHEENHHHHEDLNIKAAYLHLLSDAGMSLAVVIGGIFMYLYKIYWIDPVISIIFSLYILKETFPVLKKSYSILMESTPSNIDVSQLKKDILSLKYVKDIHDVHVWAISSKDIYFTGHILLDKNLTIEEFNKILEEIKNILNKKGIYHITIQPETKSFNCENIY